MFIRNILQNPFRLPASILECDLSDNVIPQHCLYGIATNEIGRMHPISTKPDCEARL